MKKYRGFIAGMLTMLIIVSLAGTASATLGKITKELEYRNIKVSLDGEVLDLKDAAGNHVEPFMFDGTNYLPVRALAEALGLNVAWDGTTNTVVLSSEYPESETETDSATELNQLLFSREHVRVYYLGIEPSSEYQDGYDVLFRIENESDYTIYLYANTEFRWVKNKDTSNLKPITTSLPEKRSGFPCEVKAGEKVEGVLSAKYVPEDGKDDVKVLSSALPSFTCYRSDFDLGRVKFFETGSYRLECP